MRLTVLGNRLALLAVLSGTCLPGAGCRRVPYLDQSKIVPGEPGQSARVAEEDREVRQAALMDQAPDLPLPRLAAPRTTSDPERPEIWYLELPEAIRIALDNSEVIRVIPLGAQGVQVAGFEPQFLAISSLNTLGSGNLQTIYDPAAQETRIASALSAFDANFSTTLFWNRNVTPLNNAIQGGIFATSANRRDFVILFQDTAQLAATLQKKIATGGTVRVQQNIQYQYVNNAFQTYPSVYNTNLQLGFSHPLLGSAPTSQFNPSPNPAGLEANRAPIVIARLNADFSVWQFKAEVQRMVRSVEQQYWAVAQAQVQHWAAETAVELGEQILRREQAKFEVGSGSVPNVAEAEEQLERFKLELIQRTADLITAERQLRNLLGLPPADNRRIVPVTAPTEARLEPNWESSVAQMLSFQPDIIQGQMLVRVAELQLLVARNQLLPVLNFDALYQFNGIGKQLDESLGVMTGKSIRAIDPMVRAQQTAAGLNPIAGRYSDFQNWQVGFTFQMPLGYRGPLADVRLSQYQLLRSRAFVQQLVHQTSHQLARFFLEVDLNYKAFKGASRVKEAALQRLEAQKAYYEEGQITIDRYLDAVNKWATAVATEADYKNRYNVSIVLLEEAKGTLLAYDNVAMTEGPWPARAYIQAHDQRKAHGQHPVGENGNYIPRPAGGPAIPDPVNPLAPPNYRPDPIPALPAPPGPLGPRPYPASPAAPAGEPPILSNRPTLGRGAEPGVIPVSAPVDVPPLPVAAPAGVPPLPTPVPNAVAPAPAAAPVAPTFEEIPLDLPSAPAELPSLPGGF